MKVSTSFHVPVWTTVAAAEAEPQPPQPPAEPPEDPVEQPAINWASVRKSAAIGAALWGAPAALGAIHPLAGIAGAIGVGAYAAYVSKDPRGLIVGAFIGLPSAQLGMHWGALGALGVAGVGAVGLGLNDYLAQKRAHN
ncbi:MAG: hypothetical protein HY319_12310 [Armatimonadetes bacterium]|nr:hypothetical protein [Armatimonadota bacterium]